MNSDLEQAAYKYLALVKNQLNTQETLVVNAFRAGAHWQLEDEVVEIVDIDGEAQKAVAQFLGQQGMS